ncbi:MAG: SIS domain-containing protein [Mycobacteriales bacterium]
MTAAPDDNLLDDSADLQRIDRQDRLRDLAGAAAQLRSTARLCAETLALDGHDRPWAIVIAGGRALHPGRAVAALVGTSGAVPVTVVRRGPLPGWVGPHDLVVVAAADEDRSGVAMASAAAARGSRLIGIVPAADVAGPLADAVGRVRGSVLPVLATEPREPDFWPAATALVAVVAGLGLLDVTAELFEQTAAQLEDAAIRCRPSSEVFVNPAKSLALQVASAIPAIWGATPLLTVAARRFADELTAAAGIPATAGLLGDVGDGAIGLLDGAGTSGGASTGADDFFRDRVEAPAGRTLRVVLVEDEPPAGATPDALLREAVLDLLADRGVPVTQIVAPTGPALTRFADVVTMFDFATSYATLTLGVDPSEHRAVTELAARLRPSA